VVLQEIIVSLNTLGVDFTVLETGAEGALLVLPDCGRVLGLWPHWRGENALWVDPVFLEQLRIGVKDDGWRNPGGDRMWLGPEEEFFAEGQGIPPALDPGCYTLAAEKSSCRMENKGEALAWKSGSRVRFRIERRIRPLGETELAEGWGGASFRQAGYEEQVTLEVSGDRGCPVWLWNLTQVPAGSDVRVPLRKYWGDTGLAELPPGTVGLEEGCAVVSFRGAHALRVGIAAADAGSRIICREDHEAGRSQLLVKDFTREGADASGDGLIECRWEGARGRGEFSCRSPAVGPGGKRRISWKTSLCAFSGRSDAVRVLAARLAGG
jgi:hypothetical protein